ncbi:MAG: hypothetical protein PWP04_251 [Candidatus Atribacteria bacterium]|nr:hypothetical protein [Candidatus Atribacteria bacterium]
MRWFRQYGILSLAVIFAFLLGSLGGDIPFSYSKEDMESVAKKVGTTTEAFYTTGSNQVYYQIELNLRTLDEIIEMVEEAEDFKTVMDPMVEKLEKLTISYERIAAFQPQIEEELRRKVKELQDLLRISKGQIRILEDEKLKLEEELQGLSLEQDEEARNIRERSLEMQIEFKTKEIRIWEEFLSLENKIYETVRDADRTISKFLLVLSENAKVYRGALEVVKLQRDINSLANFMNLQHFSDELISTWQDLQYLVELLTQEVNKLPAF